MKNLILASFALLAFNVSFAGELGESKADCKAYHSGKLGSGKISSVESVEPKSGDGKGK